MLRTKNYNFAKSIKSKVWFHSLAYISSIFRLMLLYFYYFQFFASPLDLITSELQPLVFFPLHTSSSQSFSYFFYSENFFLLFCIRGHFSFCTHQCTLMCTWATLCYRNLSTAEEISEQRRKWRAAKKEHNWSILNPGMFAIVNFLINIKQSCRLFVLPSANHSILLINFSKFRMETTSTPNWTKSTHTHTLQ